MVVKTIFFILLVFILLIVVLPLVLNSFGIPIGGSGGRSTAFSSSKKGIVLRSQDRAETWQTPEFKGERGDAAPSGILDIAFDSSSPNVIFAGTKASGLWKSSDKGATWSKIHDSAHALDPASDVYKAAVSARDPNIMYVAAYQAKRGKVFRSEDHGASFHEVYSVTQDNFGVFDLLLSPASADDIWIATGEGRLLASNDGGRRWRIVRSFNESLAAIAANPLFSQERYAITGFGAVSKTSDQGSTWSELGSPADNVTNTPTEIRNPYATWQMTFSSTAPSVSFAIDPHNPAALYTTRDTALLASRDAGLTWRRITSLITGEGTALGAIAIDPARTNSIMVTAGPNLYISDDGTSSWSVKTPSAPSLLKKVFIHRQHPEIIFVTTGT